MVSCQGRCSKLVFLIPHDATYIQLPIVTRCPKRNKHCVFPSLLDFWKLSNQHLLHPYITPMVTASPCPPPCIPTPPWHDARDLLVGSRGSYVRGRYRKSLGGMALGSRRSCQSPAAVIWSKPLAAFGRQLHIASSTVRKCAKDSNGSICRLHIFTYFSQGHSPEVARSAVGIQFKSP